MRTDEIPWTKARRSDFFFKAFSSLNGSDVVPWAYLRETTLPKGEINARDIHRNINHKQLLNTLINAPSCAIKKKEKSHVWGDSGLHCQFFPLGWIISTNYKCVETSPIEGGKKKKQNPDSTSPQASSLPSCFFLTDSHLSLILLPLLLWLLNPLSQACPPHTPLYLPLSWDQ